MGAALTEHARAPLRPAPNAKQADALASKRVSRPISLVSTVSTDSYASSSMASSSPAATEPGEAASEKGPRSPRSPGGGADPEASQRTIRAPFPSAPSSTHQAPSQPLPRLMRLRRTSMPAVPSVVSALSAPRGWTPVPGLADALPVGGKRMSIASVASSFDSLPEEPSSMSASSGEHSPIAGPSRPRPLLRRTAPTEPILQHARPLSLAAASTGPPPSRPVSFASDSGPRPRLSLPIDASTSAGNNRHRRKVSMRRSLSDRPPAALLSDEERARREADAVKRRHIVRELVDTERAYVAVLVEIDEHYLGPLLLAAGSSSPVLERKAISEIFANFADILALARELIRRLVHGASTPPPSFSSSGDPAATTTTGESALEPAALTSGRVGALVLPLCPFLKCYAPFVQNFARALERIEAERRTNARWRRFLDERTRRGVGRGLGLGAMLLQIVQRIPRYLLLLADLVRRTPEDDADRSELVQAHGIVEGVASFLEGMIGAHERTLAALELQRSFGSSLGDLALVAPGRSLVRSGRLTKVCRRGEQERAFFLFSDLLLCAFVGDPPSALGGWSRVASVSGLANLAASPVLGGGGASSAPWQQQQYTLSRRIDLEDVTVVAVEGLYFEIRTSTKSFAVAADSLEEKRAWIEAIHEAKDQLLGARRSLQQEEADRQAEEEAAQRRRQRRVSMPVYGGGLSGSASSPLNLSAISSLEQSRHRSRSPSPLIPSPTSRVELVQIAESEPLPPTAGQADGIDSALAGLVVAEDYSAPVWIPDARTDKCMRCSGAFGLWRRRHHCRLCGAVVCWSCSERSFVIPSSKPDVADQRARACDDCYRSVFGRAARADPAPPPSAIAHALPRVPSSPETLRQSYASA